MRELPRRTRLAVGMIAGVVASAAVVVGVGLDARANQDLVPVEAPLTTTPRVMDGRIYSIVTSGTNVMVGGTFTKIRAGTGGPTDIPQPYLFKFDVGTGKIDATFRPTLNGLVEQVRYSADGSAVYVAGDFTLVNGVAKQRLVKLDARTGAIDPTFVADTSQVIKDMELVGNKLVIAGYFRVVNGVTRERFAAVNATTGAVLPDDVPVLGSRDDFAPYVQDFDVSDDGHWLVMGGNFLTVGGQSREQMALIDLSGPTAKLAAWQTDRFKPDCASVYNDTYVRGIDVSPDGSYFAVGTTGAFYGINSMCDTASRWELPPNARSGGNEPTWTTHTGGDTHWTMHITNEAVFAGGHQRWENNPHPSPGGDNDGPGSLSRPGIAALDPISGTPLSWNPTRDRGRGVEAMASTPDHLYVGSDTAIFNGQIRQRLAVLPTAGGFENPDPQAMTLPVDLRYTVGDRLYQTRFDGSTFSAPVQVGGTGIDATPWSTVRDGFLQAGRLHFFGPSSAFFRAPLDGNALGAQTNLSTSVGYLDTNYNLTPYDQPYGVAETKAATYADGRIYYTRTNSTYLYWRWYSLQSGVVGAQEYVASYADYTNAVSFEVADGWLLAAWSDGSLYRTKLTPNGGVDRTTTVPVATSAVGIPWASVGAMFASPASGSATPFPDPAALTCTDPALPWKAVYYSTSTLTTPSFQRCEAAVNADFRSSAPAGTGLPSDNFSIRWTRSVTVGEGQRLAISAGSDDGMRVYVDGALIVNDWVSHSFRTTTGETGPLSGGPHEVVVEYWEKTGNARAVVTATPVGAIACTDPALPWSASYYPNTNLTGNPTTQRCEATIDNDWGTGAPSGTTLGSDNYSASWSRTVTLSEPKILRVTAGSDDGVRVSVDGAVVLDDWRVRNWEGTRSVDTAVLPAGAHEVEVEFFTTTGTARVAASLDEVLPPDSAAADTAIATPAEAAALNTLPVSVTGTASDDRGVAGVAVGVQDTTTGQWLQPDGVTFAAAPAVVPATLASPGATSTTWSLSLTSLANGSYAITATATDTSANADATPASRGFSIDTTPPDTTPPDGVAGTPVRNQIVTTATPTFTGTATDDRGVSRVTLAVRNLGTGQYLRPDGTWQAAFVQIPAALGTPDGVSTTWSLVAPGPLVNGNYRYEVRAFDAANNLDPTRPAVAFSVAV